MTDRVRWAMVGTGLMSELITKDFQLTENADLKVIVSRTQQRAREAAQHFGVPEGSSDYDAVLQRDDIDAIYVASPHPFHFEQASKALNAGKHVLVEKPMTVNAQQARDLISIANSNDRFLMEAMWTAFNPAVLEARKRVSAGAIGTAKFLNVNFGVAFDFNPEHRLWNKALGGGTVLDQGVYPLSLAHMFFGAPTTIHASGSVSTTGVDDEVIIALTFANGERAVCVSSMLSSMSCMAEISGTAGRIDLQPEFWNSPGFTQTALHGLSDIREAWTYNREGAGYVPMVRAVCEAILENKREHPLRTHAESVSVMETIDEVLRQVLQ